ncbi:heme exporter protein B [Blastococcus sp. DSM 46786]|uniref:heme exporter protein CcmB n=1 Tax=Blastococcus sp. DSM 46786 TaxID=1798227 RepID=UPI0008D15740|nr:heme exporter protein CcmB [Blastococcus sp. DSM 46786]SEK68958.1 heme exporter protein B [Blastococcus sp. DSM 46786]
MTAPVPRTAQVAAVLRREAAVERAGREALVTTAPFVAAFVVLAGLAFGPAPEDLAAAAGGTVWLALLVATVPLARTVAGTEIAEDSWDLLRGLVAPGALFAGKLLAAWAALLVTGLLAGGLVAVLFQVPVPPQALYGGLLGTLALAALTTGFGVLVASGSRRRGLLAALLLPAGLPALLAGTQLSTPGVPVLPWAVLVTVYAAAVVVAAWAVFPVLLEE